MSHGDGGIELEGDLALIGVLVFRQELFIGGARILRISRILRAPRIPRRAGSIIFSEALIGFFEERRVVVERLQVERAVDVQTAVAADGVAKTGTVVEFRSPYPRVMGVIRGIGIDPVEDGQFIQWQLVGGCHLLLVVERSAEVTDALLHRVFPRTILIGVEILVDGRIGLLDLGTGSTLKVEVQIPREVPSEGEVAVPEELLGEDQWQVLTLQIFQVALLQFTVVTRQLTIEGNALRQVVETQRLGEVQPLRLTLELFEGLPSLIHGRVAIVEGSTPLVLTIVDGGLALGTPMGVTIREREVGGVVGHGVTLGFQTPTHVRK